jgi:hypothetical protein
LVLRIANLLNKYYDLWVSLFFVRIFFWYAWFLNIWFFVRIISCFARIVFFFGTNGFVFVRMVLNHNKDIIRCTCTYVYHLPNENDRFTDS